MNNNISLSLLHSIHNYFNNFLNYRDKSTRRQYLDWCVVYWIGIIVLVSIAVLATWLKYLFFGYFFGFMIGNIALETRRLLDVGYSYKQIILLLGGLHLLPGIGNVLIMFYCLKTKDSVNQNFL